MKTNADYVVIDRATLMEKLKDQLVEAQEGEELDKWVRENEYMMITIPEIQRDIYENTQKWFPEMIRNDQIDLNMVMYGLLGEAGECADVLKKFIRGDFDQDTLREKLAEESIDVFHYLCMIWIIFQIDAGEVYFKKTMENELRFGNKNGQV